MIGPAKEVKREIQILNFAVSKNENKNIGQLEGWTGWTLDPLRCVGRGDVDEFDPRILKEG